MLWEGGFLRSEQLQKQELEFKLQAGTQKGESYLHI